MQFGPQRSIWITGAAGRLGSAIEQTLDHSRYRIYTTDSELDVADLNAVMDFAQVNRPDVIINCAATASKVEAENDPITAYRTNALGARNLAVASASVSGDIVHLSTDDVFSGKSRYAVNEFDTPVPNSVYGKSKLAGESLVQSLNPRHMIVRSSWIYTSREGDLFDRILTAGRTNTPLSIPVDEVGSPTSVDTFAQFVVTAMESDEFGIFHASCEGACSRVEFAKGILRLAGLDTQNVVGAYDPANAYYLELDNLMLKMTGVFEMPSWMEDLKAFMAKRNLLAQ